MKRFDLSERVKVIAGVWMGSVGTVTGYDNGKYKIRFGGQGRVVVYDHFRCCELKSIRKG